jgi:hypothetical protein
MTLKCPSCNSIRLRNAGTYKRPTHSRQQYRCGSCHRYTVNPVTINATITEKDNGTLVDVFTKGGRDNIRDMLFWRPAPMYKGKIGDNMGSPYRFYGLLVKKIIYEWRHHRSVFLASIKRFLWLRRI